MWEQIRSNRRRSVVLITFMAAILVAVGVVLAEWLIPGAWPFGIVVAVVVWLLMLLMALSAGDSLLLAAAGAHAIRKEDLPRLFNVVEEMTIASGLPKMPQVYLIDDPVPNAFAVGRRGDKAAVAVTSGLLRRLNRDELQGVVAHEIGHIKNRDVLFMTLAGVTLGAIVMLADIMLRAMWFGGGRRSRSSGSGGGNAVIVVIALVAAIVAPLMAQLLYFACSRRREYLADASAAVFTRYPEGLASALEKIAQRQPKKREVNRVLAPLYIVPPMAASGESGSWFSTHPPTKERIRILRSMAGAAVSDYEQAFQRVRGKRLLHQAVDEPGSVPIREPAAEEVPTVEQVRDTEDLLHRLDRYLFLHCACGLGIKVPESYSGKEVSCPRCHRKIAIPLAVTAAIAAAETADRQFDQRGPETAGKDKASAATAVTSPPLRYRRQGTGWETFRCECGGTVQLSPQFSAPFATCPRCGRRIEIL